MGGATITKFGETMQEALTLAWGSIKEGERLYCMTRDSDYIVCFMGEKLDPQPRLLVHDDDAEVPSLANVTGDTDRTKANGWAEFVNKKFPQRAPEGKPFSVVVHCHT